MIPHETATETYKGYRIDMLGGHIFPRGEGVPREYGWLYEIDCGNYTTSATHLPTKEDALAKARAFIDRIAS